MGTSVFSQLAAGLGDNSIKYLWSCTFVLRSQWVPDWQKEKEKEHIFARHPGQASMSISAHVWNISMHVLHQMVVCTICALMGACSRRVCVCICQLCVFVGCSVSLLAWETAGSLGHIFLYRAS